MCLIINKDKVPTRARKDIVVYKIVEEIDDGSILTPFQCKFVTIGETYKDKGKYEVKSSEDYAEDERIIQGGMFHSYPNIKEAESAKTFMNEIHSGRNFKIAKCIIPKGSLFIEGYSMIYHTCVFFTVDECKTQSVGSTAIKYLSFV